MIHLGFLIRKITFYVPNVGVSHVGVAEKLSACLIKFVVWDFSECL